MQDRKNEHFPQKEIGKEMKQMICNVSFFKQLIDALRFQPEKGAGIEIASAIFFFF